MNFKSQINGLNEFLTTIYGTEMRLSTLLSNLGFEAQQIELLRDQHLEPVVLNFIAAIKERLGTGPENERLFQIISRRYGLDGEPPETLQAIGESLGLSRERVRQLENNAVRKCRRQASLRFFTTRLHRIALAQLGVVAERPPAERIVEKLDTLAEVQAAADLTRVDYEARRAEVMKLVQAELDALEAEYEPLLKASAEHIAHLEAEIKNDVLLHGATVHGHRLRAIYTQGRVSWDIKGMAKYAELHPEILEFRKQGQPSVSLRVVK